jgi:hypothetical protein
LIQYRTNLRKDKEGNFLRQRCKNEGARKTPHQVVKKNHRKTLGVVTVELRSNFQ